MSGLGLEAQRAAVAAHVCADPRGAVIVIAKFDRLRP
jgi:hypothetical protein